MDDVHRQAKDLKDRVRKYMDVHSGEGRQLLDHVDNFVEMVEMKKDLQRLRDEIKRIQQEVFGVRDHIFSGGDGDDISDRVQDIKQAIEKLQR